MSEGEEPAPEGWTFLNIDCGDTGVFILTNHLSAFAEFIKDNADESIRELDDGFLYSIMKEFWSMVQMVFTGIGGWLGYFLGECDGLIIALLLFVVMDYITGICRKVLIFMLVGIANILDVQVIGTGSVLRTAVIFFYLSNEGISLLENAGHPGLPIPEKLKKVLEQLHDRSEEDKGGE